MTHDVHCRDADQFHVSAQRRFAVIRSMRWLLSLVILLASSIATAAGGVVIVSGKSDEATRTTVQQAAEAVAREAGWTLAAKPLTRKERDAFVKCTDAAWIPCIPPTFGPAGIERVLYVVVDAGSSVEGAPLFTVDARVIAPGADSVPFDRRHCEHCAADALALATTTLLRDLLRVTASQTGRTVLDVTTQPAGVFVKLDGEALGLSNGSFTIAPGTHVLVFEKDGYVSITRQIDVAEGTTAREVASLSPIREQDRDTPKNGERSLVPWALVATGAVFVGGGVALYAVDEEPDRNGGPTYWDTAKYGVGVASIGAVVLGIGIYRLVTDTPASTPTAARVPGGAVLGWAWRY